MVNMITSLCGYFSGTFVSDIGGTFEVILSSSQTMSTGILFNWNMVYFSIVIYIQFELYELERNL